MSIIAPCDRFGFKGLDSSDYLFSNHQIQIPLFVPNKMDHLNFISFKKNNQRGLDPYRSIVSVFTNMVNTNVCLLP